MSKYLYSDEILINASNELKKFNFLTPELDASLLLSHASSYHEKIYTHNKILISKPQLNIFNSLLAERIKGKPISRILGYRHFWKRKFLINKHTLDPRADSEIIVEAVLKKINNNLEKIQILDLGAGSGCLGLSLIDEIPNSFLLCLDKCSKALGQIILNAEKLEVIKRVEVMRLDWFKKNWVKDIKNKSDKSNLFHKDKFNIIVCNPPYIKSKDISKLAIEVKNYDPLISLDGGNDGCDAYRAILSNLKSLLDYGGTCYLEIGYDSLDNVKNIIKKSNLKIIKVLKDYNNIERVLEIK